jgi:DNA-binding transcriptional ArsR family regulator
VPRNRTASRDPAEVRHFIERFSLMLSDMGFPPMPARVWAAMMSADEDALTPGDLAERLRVSPAAISAAVRYLLQVGLLERVATPGSRRQHYRVPAGLWYQAFMRREEGLKAIAAMAEDGAATLGPKSVAGMRLAEVRDFFNFVADALPRILDDWREQYANQSLRQP